MNKFFKKEAFTLIELLVAMTVFALFISVLASSYLFLTRAQRDTNELRKIYSEGRFLMDEMMEVARGNSIAYDCYDALNLSDGTCEGSSVDALGESISGTVLATVRPDGKRSVIKLEDGLLKKVVQQYNATTLEWEPSNPDGYFGPGSGFQTLNFEKISVSSAHFVIIPAVPDPAVSPYVKIYLSLSGDSQIRESIDFDIQTTVSLRNY